MESEPQADLTPSAPDGRKGRVQARVALALLEALRDQDRPLEILDDENVYFTLPRRFGLSEVVHTQIQRYQEEARRGRRVPQVEVRDLIRLVTRRPDAEDVFRQVGESLTEAHRAPRWRRVLPARMAMPLARRRLVRRLGVLFGRPFARIIGKPFHLEVTNTLLVDGDPGGEACHLVTGLAQTILDTYVSPPVHVTHSVCRSSGGSQCLWTAAEPESSQEGHDPPSAT